MSNDYSPRSSEINDPITQKWGCLIFILSLVLFAIERYLLFSALVPLSAIGNLSATQILGFLYGNYPYSLFDVLLGFQIPDEGLFFIFQPHNFLLGFVQVIHFAINFGLVSLFFWTIEKFRTTTQSRPGLRFGGYLSLLVVVVGLAFAGMTCINSSKPSTLSNTMGGASPTAQINKYSGSTSGIHFDYPSFMKLQENIKKERGTNGELITLTSISGSSTDPVVGLFVQIIEDPLRNQMFPSLYPNPSDQLMRTLVAGDIGNLNFPKTASNNSAAISASNNAAITKISGNQAATYKASFEGTSVGHAQLRGILVITDRRDISIYLIGSDEPDVTGSIDAASLDTMWSTILNSVSIDF